METVIEIATGPRTGETLLIVEDAVLTAMSLRDALEDAGYRVLDLTSRLAEALAAAIQHKPALALVNIKLQGRDDGIELAKQLKAMGVPVMFISGQVSRASSARTMAVASFPKPYDAAQMPDAVAYILRSLHGDDSLLKPDGLEAFGKAEHESA